MQTENPYAPPKSSVIDSDLQALNRRIDNLEVSDRWKERFRAIAAAGGPSLKDFKTLSKEQRKRVSHFNALAFLFGPIYYLTKGMWKKAIVYTALMLVIIVILSIIFDHFGFPRIADSLRFGAPALFAVRANIDLYKKSVLGDNGWL